MTTLSIRGTLIAQTDKGFFFRYSEGEYPYSSSVILEGEIEGKPFKWSYPTEINPRGELEVDADQRQLLEQLEAKPRLKVEWSNVYPRSWESVEDFKQCCVVGSLMISYIEGEQLTSFNHCQYYSGSRLGTVSQPYPDIASEPIIATFQQKMENLTIELQERQKINLQFYVEKHSNLQGYYPMWSSGYCSSEGYEIDE